jgi:alkylation response protein AidB-like acyl-CoA dehydrogenase
MVSTVESRSWVDRARALEPLVERWRDAAEEQRRLPAELFEVLRASGLFRIALPKAFGGNQAGIGTITSVIEEISRQDGAVGWNALISCFGGSFADYLPESAARKVFATGDEVAVGSFAPSGRAVRTDGGYRVSGRWDFGSGCHNATWLTGGFLLMEDGQPRLNPDGSPDIRILIFPRDQAEILDTWHTAGLRGTGSHDYQVHDLFVPEDHGFPFFAFFRGPEQRPGVGYPVPFLPHLVAPPMAAVALGIARQAIESFKALAKTKKSLGATLSLAEQPLAQLRLGEAEGLLRSARAYLYEVVAEVESATGLGPEQIDELGASVRLASAYAVQNATRAVDLMFDAAGGSSVYASSRLERCFRDVHMVSHHAIVSPSNIELVGQYLLGLGLRMRR